MAFFPTSVASHLQAAGFSSTELLVLRHMDAGAAFTLRELAAKTGKSTGVLDQATKKLIQKGIIERDTINNRPKYVLVSLDAIADWIAGHTNQTVHQLKLRERDVAAYLRSLKSTYRRPQIEYFEGMEGIEQACKRILETETTEQLLYIGIKSKEEDHYLSPFLNEWSNDRLRKNVSLRVITHDSSYGRRFSYRDHLANRQTVLIPQSLHPCHCDQIIAGDTLTCFRPQEQTACLLKFPLLAEAERRRFNALWNQYEHQERISTMAIESLPISLLEGLPVLA